MRSYLENKERSADFSVTSVLVTNILQLLLNKLPLSTFVNVFSIYAKIVRNKKINSFTSFMFEPKQVFC